jgi:hypothetical protein
MSVSLPDVLKFFRRSDSALSSRYLPNNSGRNLKRHLESHPSFKDIFQDNSDPGTKHDSGTSKARDRLLLIGMGFEENLHHITIRGHNVGNDVYPGITPRTNDDDNMVAKQNEMYIEMAKVKGRRESEH